MSVLQNDEQEKAYRIWLRSYRLRQTELELRPYLNSDIKPYGAQDEGWLKKARTGLFLSCEQVATNMKVTRRTYSNCEQTELAGTVTLARLARAAEAMDCELVYAIRPKSRKLYSQIVWSQLLKRALTYTRLKASNASRLGGSLAFRAKFLAENPSFRREQGWSKWSNG